MQNLVFALVTGLAYASGALGQSVKLQPVVDERKITLDRPASLVALSRNGDMLATVIDGHRVEVYSALDGRRLMRLPDRKAPV